MSRIRRFLFLAPSPLFMFTAITNAEMVFPTELLNISGGEVADISNFNADGKQLPGQYQVDIYLNDTFIKNKVINFISPPTNVLASKDINDETGLAPCLSVSDLSDAGIKTELFPDIDALDGKNCTLLSQYIPGAFSLFNFQKMRLDLTIPQIYVRNDAQGYIDPTLWDDGINAALLNYNFNGSQHLSGPGNNKSYFLNLNSGFNIGPWRLRDYRTWNYYESHYGKRQQWQRINSYLERPIVPIRSTLLAGEGTTMNDIFDPLRFRGIELTTDENMLPDTMRGFAPVVRGNAESNAEVSIRQNGYTIYKTSVPPGPFQIDDLNPMASSGDLEITVNEADGRTHVFTVPYASVPVLLREGRFKYGMVLARYRGDSSSYDNPAFAQGTIAWGGPQDITLYGGIQYSHNYKGIQSGMGVNMGNLGAVSADITHANSTLADGKDYQGQSMRFLYARSFNETGTRFRLTGYRYSTKGFHTFDETALKKMSGRLYDHHTLDENGYPAINNPTDYYNLYNSKRARFEANISQSVGGYGSVWLSGVRQTYWNNGSSNDSLRAGYSGSVGTVNYSLSYGYSRQKTTSASSYSDRSIGLSFSLPLAKLLPASMGNNNAYATFYGSRDSQGNSAQQAGLSGSLLEQNNLNWSVSHGYNRSQWHSGGSGNASLSYKGTYGNTGLGYSYGTGYQQVSYNAAGGILVHNGGVTFGQPLGDTSVLISSDGVPNVSIQSESGVNTDWRGYAIKPYASPYRETRVSIDSGTLDDKTDLINSSTQKVVPTKGAIVRTSFALRRGQRVLLTLTHNGKPLPFGSVVTADNTSGLVGDDGLVYLSGMPDKGAIRASWGKGTGQSCQASYNLSTEMLTESVAKITGECR